MDILFWSGGKDAWLALQFFKQKFTAGNGSLKLLTTYEESSGVVPYQNVSLQHIKEQAQKLGRKLISVGLPKNCPNEIYLQKIGEALEKEREEIRFLIFGDWYLQDIRAWREKVFGEMGYDCLFPIWEKPLDELLPELIFKPVEVHISAVAEEYRTIIRVGEVYNQVFIRQLPPEVDPLGEKGEFHTKLSFKSWETSALK